MGQGRIGCDVLEYKQVVQESYERCRRKHDKYPHWNEQLKYEKYKEKVHVLQLVNRQMDPFDQSYEQNEIDL